MGRPLGRVGGKIQPWDAGSALRRALLAQAGQHVRDIVRLAQLHALRAQDGVSGQDVEIKLGQRPVARIAVGRQVEDHAIGQVMGKRGIAGPVQRVCGQAVEQDEGFESADTDWMLNPRKDWRLDCKLCRTPRCASQKGQLCLDPT